MGLFTDNKTIQVTCEGATTVNVSELHDLQGEHFKRLTQDSYEKLKASMIKFGFSFPVFMWIEPDTQIKWAIDGHQRNFRVIPKMTQEGFIFPPLPAVIIHAKDKKEAKEKLLVLNSRYGEITQDGFTDFINEEGSELIEEDLEDYVEIPEFDLSTGEDITEEPKTPGIKEPKELECPECHAKFTPK